MTPSISGTGAAVIGTGFIGTVHVEALRKIGVKLEPFELPKLTTNVFGGILGVESGASFDEFVRRGRTADLTNKGRANGMRQSHLVPGVEYLQAQRVRAMVMRQFADAVSRFDVYVAPYLNMRTGGAGRGTEDGRGGEGGRGSGRGANQPPNAIREHFQATNICGYPAVADPKEITADGKPTSITFSNMLYGEAPMLALARAYQEAAGWHLRHPRLT